MVTLNLEATNTEQEKIKRYLEENASNTLAEKINNGVKIAKDGKTLISKKDLTTFMQYAEEEVLKLIAESERKGRQVRCIDDSTVFGWAIHYFEEDSIEGKLYNEDGTEYQPPKPVKKTAIPATKPKTTPPAVTYTPPQPAPKPQLNIFDMLSNSTEPKTETQPATEVHKLLNPEPKKGSAMYQHYLSVKEKYSGCIVFYRLGDFYEIYGDAAVTVAKVLDLTLTGRDCGLDERVPMAGIPFHSADAYIAKLVKKDYKVAICEPINGEETAERIITKQPEDNRLVDEITGEILPEQIEELSVEEMRQFDGDLVEPKELPTIAKVTEGIDIQGADEEFDIEKERQAIKAFDVEAMVILQELFDNKITIV